MRLGHFLGGILLIAGTTIGGGMLALPVMTAFAGFFPSIFLLGICWLYLLITGFLFLEVNLQEKKEANLITMAEHRLGKFGKWISWTAYLLLLYCLTAAYIAGGSPIFSDVLQLFWKNQAFLNTVSPLIFVLFLGVFVYLGTRSVDCINRIFLVGLIFTYGLLACFLPFQVKPELLMHKDPKALFLGIPIVVSSFGFHIIIPTLTTYLHRDRKKLQQIIFLGSLIPLLAYVVWEFLFLGTVPLTGEHSLLSVWEKGQNVAIPLKYVTSKWLFQAAYALSFFAIITSFLGVSLSLKDFLKDGLKLKHNRRGRFLAVFCTFLPPLLFVFVYPQGFIQALQYGAVFVAILLGILPALMAWTLPSFRGFFRRGLLVAVILFSLFVIIVDFLEEAGNLSVLTEKYQTREG
jgi:tyrosine-specific transport protein